MNKNIRILYYPIICALLWIPPSLSAAEQVREHGTAVNIIWSVLPLFLIGVVLWLYLKMFSRMYGRIPSVQRSITYYERSEQHMERMERIGERIAAALEDGENGTNETGCRPEATQAASAEPSTVL
jgi:hypothetical protein